MLNDSASAMVGKHPLVLVGLLDLLAFSPLALSPPECGSEAIFGLPIRFTELPILVNLSKVLVVLRPPLFTVLLLLLLMPLEFQRFSELVDGLALGVTIGVGAGLELGLGLGVGLGLGIGL